MSSAGLEQTSSLSVEQIAGLVRQLDRGDQLRLLKLVPELREAASQTLSVQDEGRRGIESADKWDVTPVPARPPVEEAGFPPEQKELIAYFDQKLALLPERRPMQDNDPFLGGLTVGEFFALPEVEQARIWDEAYAEAERALENREQPIRPDAVPAR
jgi:hypothetical protein